MRSTGKIADIFNKFDETIFGIYRKKKVNVLFIFYVKGQNFTFSPLVGSVQYTCPVVPLCIVDLSLSH